MFIMHQTIAFLFADFLHYILFLWVWNNTFGEGILIY